jgi:GT2 family glycosyltransferase/glycosyltransferase involved in cell wall biosynthesis
MNVPGGQTPTQGDSASALPPAVYALLVNKEQEFMRLRGLMEGRQHQLRIELHEAKLGGAWRLVQLLRRCRKLAAPADTRRDRCLRLLTHAVQVCRREGVRGLFARGRRRLSGVGHRPSVKDNNTSDSRQLIADNRQPSYPPLDVSDDELLREILALEPRQVDPNGRPIDVVVPVYKGIGDTLRCLRSVLTAVPAAAYELIVINDCGPEPALLDHLRDIARRGLVRLLENAVNMGFVKSANRGLALHPDRDVVLLNSDTEVCRDWLDRLHRAAYSAKNVGTVTPLSNNATICSYPAFCRDNPLPDALTPDQLDELCAALNDGDYVDVPTGVGFCMYFRRDCLRAVDFLDEEHFGKGYGEENDFCMRAMRHGWHHLLTTDTFVYHRGGTSFGASKNPAMQRAMKVMEDLHPDYASLIAGHFVTNPALVFRRRLDLARVAGPRPALLFVTHDRGGGTERHVLDLAHRLEQEERRAIVLRPTTYSRVTLERPAVKNTPNLIFALPEERWTLLGVLRDLGVEHVHVHHMLDVPREVFRLIDELGVPYDWTVHDYYPVCPRINFIDETGIYCGEPGPARCQACLDKNGAHDGERADILRWREEFAARLAGARRVFVPHRDVAERLARYFPGVAFHERRHPEVHPDARIVAAPFAAGETLRVAILGTLALHKGLKIVSGCARDAWARRLPLLFHIIGDVEDDSALRGMSNVVLVGRYREDEIFDILESLRCHCAFFPSVWPETYSFTLSLALLGGLPPVAFDLGSLAARIRECGYGHLIPLTQDAAAINDELLTQARRMAGFQRVQRWTPPIYRSVLEDYYGLTGSAARDLPDVA